MVSRNASLPSTESSFAVAPFGSACLDLCLTTAETWGTQIRQEQKGQKRELQAHQLTVCLSCCTAKPRSSWGAFCTGNSQMSRGLTVLIKHLRNLAGSPLHYPWCSRMFSGDLPLLSLLSELLSYSMSPFVHSEETLTLGPDGEKTLPNCRGSGVFFNHLTQNGHYKVVGGTRCGMKSRLRGIALLVEPSYIAWSCILEWPRGKLHVSG